MSGFRKPLDLSEIYEDFNARWARTSTAGGKITSSTEEAEERRALLHEPENPMKVGRGPADFSTCTVLVPSPQVCWDVNGYYRTLRVHWKATRKELMSAYQAFGPMPTAYQTHCFKQLLNPEIRRAYDASPLGEPFLDDEYVQAYLKRQAADEARKRSQAGTFTTAEEVIKENFDFHADTPEGDLDEGSLEEDASATDDLSEDDATFVWPYGFYLWKTRERDDSMRRMADWQQMLVAAIAERGEVVRLGVGCLGRMAHPYVVAQVGNQRVVFLNDNTSPSEDLAASVAAALSEI